MHPESVAQPQDMVPFSSEGPIGVNPPQPPTLWSRLESLCKELSAEADCSLDKAKQDPSCGWHPGRAQGLARAHNKLHAILYSDEAAEIRPPGQKVGLTEGPPPVSTVGPAPS